MPDILSNFHRSSVIDAARVFMAISIISSYGVLTFCGKTALLNCFKSRGNDDEEIEELIENGDSDSSFKDWLIKNWFYYSITIVWVVGSILLGIYVPDISNVISLIGNLAAAFIFIFPGLLSIKAIRGLTGQLVLPIAMVVFGVFLMGVCLTLDIQQILNKSQDFVLKYII